MNTLNETPTYVFCSQCDFVTSNFLEWAGEFWCQEKCTQELPSEAIYEAQLANWEANHADSEWLASAGWGDDEDYY